jgi:hypothetical protein
MKLSKVLSAATLLTVNAQAFASDFTWDTTLPSQVTLESTEMNSLTNGSVSSSTVGGSAGVFAQSNFS